MSKKSIEAAILAFLKSDERGVLCIRGKWGTGKTYMWNQTLKAAARREDVAFDRYAYVSLFGINSLAELKAAIVERTVSVTKKENLELAPTEESVKEVIKRGEEFLRKGSFAAGGLLGMVGLGSLGAAASRFMLITIRRQIVCFDDLERRGAGLSMNDVLGMASHLKEERKCKVGLILNDEKLEGNAEEDFKRYLEKVIDTAMVFEPTVEECAAIGVGESTATASEIAAYMEVLEITNIRVIQRIKRLVDEVAPVLAGKDARLLTEAVKTLCVLGWIEYLPDVAPKWEFAKNRSLGRAMAMAIARTEEPPEHKRWNDLLDMMEMCDLTEFDLALQLGVRQGYFDKEALEGFADLMEQHLKNEDIEAKLRKAFRMFESMLAPNEDEVVEAFVDAVKTGVERVQTATLNAIVIGLKNLARTAEATDLIQYVLSKRAGDRAFFRRSVDPITDQELKQALAARAPAIHDNRSLPKVLTEGLFGFDAVSVTRLQKASAPELKEALKTLDGNVEEVLGALLQREEVAENGKAIRENVLEALKVLASETRINELRLKKYVTKAPP